MKFKLLDAGGSKSFPPEDPLHALASEDGEVLVIIGREPFLAAMHGMAGAASFKAVLIELGTECLGHHTGESMGGEGSNVLGFSRFRLGDAAPTSLVELVRQPMTSSAAIAAAQAFLEHLGLSTAVCSDTPGRILDRLMRPYFNAALARLDDGLATGPDIDRALRLGLGYPKGPIELLAETGLASHYEVTAALHATLDAPGFLPARRAQIAFSRAKKA